MAIDGFGPDVNDVTTMIAMMMMTTIMTLTLSMTGLCEDSVVIDGVGYRAHPYEADKYIQCYFPSQGVAVIVVRECPFGTLWNPHARLCDPFHRVRLANGKISCILNNNNNNNKNRARERKRCREGGRDSGKEREMGTEFIFDV